MNDAGLTIKQMHTGIRLAVQQVDANFMDGLLTQEIDYYINETIQNFVKDRYDGWVRDGRGFEQSQKRIDDLRTVYMKDVEIDALFLGSPLTGFYIDRGELPENYMILISQRSKIKYNRYQPLDWSGNPGATRTAVAGSERIVFNKLVQSDDIYRTLSDPNNTTDFSEPLSDINGNHINVYSDEQFIVEKLIINYLRYPAIVALDTDNPENSVDCDLAAHTHREIVRLAAALITDNLQQLQSQRQQQQPTQ